jgi:hypothetical protein
MNSKKKSSRSRAQKSGFKKSNVPLDRGYTKPTKDGERLHKYGKSSKIHKDRVDPAKTYYNEFYVTVKRNFFCQNSIQNNNTL